MRGSRTRRKVRVRGDIRVDGTYDIECAGWDYFVVGVTHHIERGTQVHWTLESLVDELVAAGGWWWSHNGGSYDALAVLQVLRERERSMSCAMSGSRVSRATGGGLVLCDSYSLIPLGLEHAARLAGLEAPRLSWPCTCQRPRPCGGYCQIQRRMSAARKRELAAYCVRDAEVLYAALCALREYASEQDYDLRGTVGGSAWATAQRQLALRDADHYPALWSLLRGGYYGGRTSVFRPLAGQGTQWDIVSAYPGALGRTAVPVGDPSEGGTRQATSWLARDRAGIYAATVRVPDMMVPPLPWVYDGERIAYPVGEVSGVWTQPELAAAVAAGVTIEHVEWGVSWPRTETVYASLMRDWTDERRRQGRETARGMWLRERQNSLAGKLAEGPDKRMVRICPPLSEVRLCAYGPRCEDECTCGAYTPLDPWSTVWSVPFWRPSPSSHIEHAAYLTSAVRVQWRDAAVRSESALVYGDTDSLWLLGDTAPGERGDSAGQWREVCAWRDMEVRAPKSYAWTHLGGQRDIYALGERVLRTAGASVSPAEWQRGTAIQDRGVLSLTSAARSGGSLFARRRERWTLPSAGDWYGDRLLAQGDSVTHAVTCEELENKVTEDNRRRESKRQRRR